MQMIYFNCLESKLIFPINFTFPLKGTAGRIGGNIQPAITNYCLESDKVGCFIFLYSFFVGDTFFFFFSPLKLPTTTTTTTAVFPPHIVIRENVFFPFSYNAEISILSHNSICQVPLVFQLFHFAVWIHTRCLVMIKSLKWMALGLVVDNLHFRTVVGVPILEIPSLTL